MALAPPPDLRSSFRPTYNLAVNLVRRFDRPTALEVLRRSFAQWQARPRRRHGRGTPLVEHLGRRLAVLEELGYVDGWRLTARGRRLARIYHEADLLVAEAVAGEILEGAEPSVLAGVLSALVFERRRARRALGHPGRRRRAGPARAPARWPGKVRRPGRRPAGGAAAGRAGRAPGRLLGHHAERLRAVEEVHLVPRTRQPEPGLAGAVAAWARGATFGTVLEVAARDVGEIAPGDFVRTVKQVADLAGQVALVAPDRATGRRRPQAVAAARSATWWPPAPSPGGIRHR